MPSYFPPRSDSLNPSLRIVGKHSWSCLFAPTIREQQVTWQDCFPLSVLTITYWFSGNPGGEASASQPHCNARGKLPIGQPICSVTDSSNVLTPFQAICTPIQTRKKDDNCVITVIPVAPRIRANRSANP